MPFSFACLALSFNFNRTNCGVVDASAIICADCAKRERNGGEIILASAQIIELVHATEFGEIFCVKTTRTQRKPTSNRRRIKSKRTYSKQPKWNGSERNPRRNSRSHTISPTSRCVCWVVQEICRSVLSRTSNSFHRSVFQFPVNFPNAWSWVGLKTSRDNFRSLNNRMVFHYENCISFTLLPVKINCKTIWNNSHLLLIWELN